MSDIVEGPKQCGSCGWWERKKEVPSEDPRHEGGFAVGQCECPDSPRYHTETPEWTGCVHWHSDSEGGK